MDIDSLLELLGVRSRPAQAETDAEGNYIAPPEEEEQRRNEYMRRVEAPPPPPNDDLMEIVRRNQGTGFSRPAQTEARSLQPAAAAINNSTSRNQQHLGDQASAISEDQRRLTDIEAEIAQAMERQQRQAAMTPEMARPDPAAPARPYINASAGATMPPLPNIPRPTANPLPQQSPYAHLDRAGPPFQTANAEPPPAFLPSSGTTVGASVGALGANIPAPTPTPPIDFASAPQTSPNPAAVDPAMVGYNPIVNGGPWQTMAPPDPFMDANPQLGPTGSPSARPPPPTPNYTPPTSRTPVPFSMPSAAMRLALPAAEGESVLDQLRAVPQAPQEAFAPEGEVINWWNFGRGQNQPAPTPQRAVLGLRRVPTPAPGPDQSTILNQQELARFLTANGGSAAAPPAPATTPTPDVRSALPIAPTPVPAGAIAMTPPAPPAPGNQLPPALKDQLLQEAYRIVASRGAPKPQGAPAR